jgi:phosphatidate phosphatase APP1
MGKKPSDFIKQAADAAGRLKDTVTDAVGAVKEEVAEKVGEVRETVAELADDFRKDKEVIAFPAYGYRKGGDGWAIPLRVWVSKARRLPAARGDAIGFDEVVDIFRRDMGHLDPGDLALLRSRVRHFVADDDSGETVTVKFEADPDGQTYELSEKTDPNGLVEQTLEISAGKARQLLDAQASSGWLSFKAAAGDFEGAGRVRLIEPRGLSLISDIDDTIKVTDVPAGKPVVLRNVFLRDYETTPGMDAMYRAFGDAVTFHYVSGSPWQLYKILGDFLVGPGKFPEGTFHMRSVRKNLLRARESWEDFKNFVAGSEGILKQKVEQISELFDNLPEREFILVGDSGEKDPEVFRQIKDKYGARVRKIFIRDVLGKGAKPHPERLAGMAVIEPAGAVVTDVGPEGFGVTRFAD